MARSVRIEYPGAFYHVMARGNRRERIFRDDDTGDSFAKRWAKRASKQVGRGPRTTAAVRRFQQFCKENAGGENRRIIDSGPVDGIAGPIRKRALLSFYGS